ncbi:hypothetical protein N7468_007779 [Penicillium chermesinum]|uniref:FAD/NAD(P)-binding domain-containing protein n=1 Tax=Penicillium chermesinum TaxID=63820 RepID=A0A9W9NNG7_9EURO|nr:uncharacterized protein N7468_007779 [Penicillium chermesinum]KAJ5223237.1 hypothetical protein N7468_007779 [Penicillium chermesinum]
MLDEYPPLAALPQLALHSAAEPGQLNAADIVDKWLSSLTESLRKACASDIHRHFLEKESWWRDFISLSWDIACHNGADAIGKYLGTSTTGFQELHARLPGALQPQVVDMGGLLFIQSGFTFKTNFGAGRGILRLANVGPDEWKAWTVFTVLEGFHESEGMKSPSAIQEDDHLQVLVVGQAGLAIAAHLQELGIKYLVVDKTSRPGESWRARYESIRSHTPIYSDHFPFLKFPSNWPRYLDQPHIVRWIEHYGDKMRLNIQHGTIAKRIEYSDSTQRYSVDLQNDQGTKTIQPKHVVLATGLFSDTAVRPDFPDEDSFKGEIYHTSAHRSAALVPGIQSKKITIIGSGTSAHDIAKDFAHHGAKTVTMVQRNPIYVASLDSLETFQLALWNTPGVSTEDADLLGNSFPTPLVRTLGVGASQMMSANDKALLDGLENAGLAVKRGNGDSLVDYQLIKGGHFYIDQGASQMIIDGRIQIRRCEQGVQGYCPEGVILRDGTRIQSDIVVLATGFERGSKVIERLMGKSVMDKIGDVFGLDESQERIGVG